MFMEDESLWVEKSRRGAVTRGRGIGKKEEKTSNEGDNDDDDKCTRGGFYCRPEAASFETGQLDSFTTSRHDTPGADVLKSDSSAISCETRFL